jgi:isopropylmalate/homocitrate/citramalate synthase
LQVTLCDVGPRDDLQNEPDVLEPGVRAELVNSLAATGLPSIEALIGVSTWLEGVLGRPLPGQVYRAGTFAAVAG